MFDIICRDFAYVARDRMTRMHMCHVFQCDTPARQIANTLRDICKRIMQERGLQPAHPTTQRRPTDLPNLEKLGQPPGSTPPSSLFNSEIIHQASFQQICFWLSLAFPLQHHLSPSAVFPLLLCISCFAGFDLVQVCHLNVDHDETHLYHLSYLFLHLCRSHFVSYLAVVFYKHAVRYLIPSYFLFLLMCAHVCHHVHRPMFLLHCTLTHSLTTEVWFFFQPMVGKLTKSKMMEKFLLVNTVFILQDCTAVFLYFPPFCSTCLYPL